MPWPGAVTPIRSIMIHHRYSRLQQLARNAQQWWSHWAVSQRRFAIALVAFVGVATGGAYGVVSVAPSDADVPVHALTEVVQSPYGATPADSENLVTQPLYYATTTRPSDTVESLMVRLNVVDQAAVQFFRMDPQVQYGLQAGGRLVKAQTNERRQLQEMTVIWPSDREGQFNRLMVARSAQGFRSQMSAEPLLSVRRFASGEIQTSLFAATDSAGIPDAVAAQIAEIFSGEIDFHRALRKGDRFAVVYEALLADGELLRTGRVLASEFSNSGKVSQALWFEAPSFKGGYFSADGKSLTKTFLASPLEFSRVTSGFSMRLHPILKQWRAHLGVDYGAPTGTPVRAVGAGVVAFAGVQGGFGNVVHLDHGNDKTTVYAHLSAIGVKKGQVLEQGQVVGAVGATGWATGPHLHFEFRIAGEHQDPIQVAKQSEQISILPTALRSEFVERTRLLTYELSWAHSVQLASAQ